MARALPRLLLAGLLVGACTVPTEGDRGQVAAIDTTAPATVPAAGDDFYLHVNHEWMAANPIPAEYGSWGVAHEILTRNEEILRGILEEAAARRGEADVDHVTRLLGTMYASGMDEARAEAYGAEAIRLELDLVDGIQSAADIPGILGYLHVIGVGALFSLEPVPDLYDSEVTIAFLMQGGLGLPERDYYLREDAESIELREAYVAHVARMLGLAGADAETAAAEAEAILAFETVLAGASLTAVELRDTANLANRIDRAALEALTPRFNWAAYQFALGLEAQPVANVVGPGMFQAFDRLLAEKPIEDWRAYLRWHLLSRAAPYLSKDFAREDFDFHGRVLSGREVMRERWKRVQASINDGLGEALGQAYVERAFGPEAKQLALTMVEDLLAAYRVRLREVEWMGEETRAAALRKLDSFTVKIGYPDRWQDWSGLQLDDAPWVRNVFAASAFNAEVALARIGKPTDRSLWAMSPQTLNAYYNPLANEIVFPAAIMQPPFFSVDQPMAANYGAMGAIIGHEITHGFDDLGSQFDPAGNLEDWWTAEDRAEFERRAAVLVEQYDAYVAIDDLHVDGQLTLGENIADLGGLKMAHAAFMNRSARELQSIGDGWSREQQFFRAWARTWRENFRPETLKLQVQTDEHAPNRFRANGPLENLPAFAEAFGLDESAPMVRPASARAEVW